MNERILEEKLRKLEALYARPGTDGEREAAESAIQRIKARLEEFRREESEDEFRFGFRDGWSRTLFLALCRRYGLRPYRYTRQRHTTVMVRLPATFVQETLWPEFLELNKTLRHYLHRTTDRIIQDGIHKDTSEEEYISPTMVGDRHR
jgi:hypothetical protein